MGLPGKVLTKIGAAINHVHSPNTKAGFVRSQERGHPADIGAHTESAGGNPEDILLACFRIGEFRPSGKGPAI